MLYVHLQTKTTRSVCTSKRFVEGPREIQISLRLQGRHERHNIALTAFNFAYASRSNRSIVSRQRFVSPNPEMAAVRHLRLQHDSRGGGTRGWWQIRPIENLPLHTRKIGGDDPRQARDRSSVSRPGSFSGGRSPFSSFAVEQPESRTRARALWSLLLASPA